MTNDSEDHDANSDHIPLNIGLDISKLRSGDARNSEPSEALRKASENLGSEASRSQEMHDKDKPHWNQLSEAEESIKRAFEPFSLKDRMRSLGVAAGADSSLGRLAEQIGAQQNAIDALRLREFEFVQPLKLDLPPNPMFETNERLERIEERFKQMQVIATDAAQIATGLQAAAAEFLQKFEEAAADNGRAARHAIRIGAVAVIIAVAMPTAQILYSEYRREPSSDPEIRAELGEVQAELSAMHGEQAEASRRMNEALTASDSEISAILRDIRTLLSQGAEAPDFSSDELPR